MTNLLKYVTSQVTINDIPKITKEIAINEGLKSPNVVIRMITEARAAPAWWGFYSKKNNTFVFTNDLMDRRNLDILFCIVHEVVHAKFPGATHGPNFDHLVQNMMVKYFGCFYTHFGDGE